VAPGITLSVGGEDEMHHDVFSTKEYKKYFEAQLRSSQAIAV
jgi:hypothetical protein